MSLLLFMKNNSWVLITIYEMKASGHEKNNGVDNMCNQMEQMVCGVEKEAYEHK